MYLSDFPKAIMIPIKPLSAQSEFGVNYKEKRTFRTKKYANHKEAVAEFLKLHGIVPIPRDKAVILDITFVFGTKELRKHGEYHINRPDKDNLEKSVMDAMNTVVYQDDSQVCDGRVKKLYGPESMIVIKCRTF